MLLPWIRKWLRNNMGHSSRGKNLRQRLGTRSLYVEVLEDRTLLSTVTAIITPLGPTSIQEGSQSVTLTGNATDTNSVDQLSSFDYEWVVKDQSLNVVAQQSTNNPLLPGPYSPDTFTFTPSEAGTYTVTLTAMDQSNFTSPAATQIITATDASLHATKGPDITLDVNNLPLVEGGTTAQVTLATFTDDNTSAPPTDFTATIDWGDGTPPVTGDLNDGTIVVNVDGNNQPIPGSFLVQGSHQYNEAGTFTISVTIKDVDGASVPLQGSNAPQAVVGEAQTSLVVTAKTITPTAGAPFTGVVASFTVVGPPSSAGSYTATITWGDLRTSAGTVTANGSGGFDVTGTHTYAAPGTYTTQIKVTDAQSNTDVDNGSAIVASLGKHIQDDQTEESSFWHSDRGQKLINSFNGGPSATALASWLATNFINLYGVNAGANDLTGKTNAQVAKFYRNLFEGSRTKLDAQVMATALNVYATTLSLGGTAAQKYGFLVSAYGLGADSFNVERAGLAFGVANFTKLNIYQILQSANNQAVNGVLYFGNQTLGRLAFDVFEDINEAGD